MEEFGTKIYFIKLGVLGLVAACLLSFIVSKIPEKAYKKENKDYLNSVYKKENKNYLNSVYEKFENLKPKDTVVISNEKYNVVKIENPDGRKTYWLKNEKGSEIITALDNFYSNSMTLIYKESNKSCTYILNWNNGKYAFLNYSSLSPENVNWIQTEPKNLTIMLEKLMKETISQCNENNNNITTF